MPAYIFVHFIGEEKNGEQIYFAVSKDGLFWEDLNQGKPVLYSHIGACGVRDPYLVKHPITGKFYLIATDLCIGNGTDWDTAVNKGSKSIIVWESQDLIHWEKERACQVMDEKVGCVWAPEAIFDYEKETFMVFWASLTKEEGEKEPKHKIYASYTDDFKHFSEAFLYLERTEHVIDTTIVRNHENYYRISKDETNKALIVEKGKTLTGTFSQIKSETLEHLQGVEGPECFRMPDGRHWCLIADQFAKRLGYLPMITSDLESGEFRILQEEEYNLGKNKKRHGGIMEITEQEYERLLSEYRL